MAIILNTTHLATLGLSLADLQGLPEEEQLRAIKRAYRKLTVVYHPDKNIENPAHAQAMFQKIDDALKALTAQDTTNEEFADELSSYVFKPLMTIPATAFDIVMMEGILDVLQRLRREFLWLDNEEKKREFATYYASFLTVAEHLETQRTELMETSLGTMEYESISEFLARQWAMLIIRLFAEEYLHDFQYRDAMVFRDLRPILATRKLISPVKWLALIIGSLDLLFRRFAGYALGYWGGGGY